MTRPGAILHATTVAIDGRGVLITGASGSGKSGLAIELLARGATLVSDDRTEVSRDGPRILASAPDAIEGLIEARFVGLIRVAPAGPTALRLVIDMDQVETERLPQPHTQDVLDVALPCLHKGATPHFPSSVLLYVKALI